MAHPVPQASSAEVIAQVPAAFVIPVHDDAAGLERLLRAVRRDFVDEQIVVVDDASADAAAIAAVANTYAADLVRHESNRGPAAARNTGWKRIVTLPGDDTLRPQVTLFLDADVAPAPGAVGVMLAHFVDRDVAVVAARVRAQPGLDAISHYEVDNSPLDMGPAPAIVRPGTRVSYVPSAALAVRAHVVAAARGFDEAMRYGEDVDLVWRLIAAGHLVRYEPAAVTEHRNRTGVAAFVRQRFGYGTSAAELAVRHGDSVAPLQLPMPVVGATLAAAFGRWPLRILAGAIAFNSAAELSERLQGKVDEPAVEAARLSALTHAYALRGLAAAATRAWAPLLLPFRSARRALAAALVVPALVDWVRHRGRHGSKALDPIRFVAIRAVDHGAYCAGVWAGALRRRSIAALLPGLRFSFDDADR